MRVVWNIVENGSIETIQTMIGAIRLIDNLSDYSHDIYNHLKDRDISNDFAKEQMKEEKEKARQIADNKELKDQDGKTWEDKIIEAEKHAFFKGAIRFLFTVSRESESQYDWNKFDIRFDKSKKYFDEKGVKENYRKDALLLRSFISYFDDWGMFWGMVYDNSIVSWKDLLTNAKWIKPTSCLFDNDLPDFNNWKSQLLETNDTRALVHDDLVKSQLLNVVQASCSCRLNWRYGKYALYPPRAYANWKKYVIGDKRNETISKLCLDNIIECNQKLGDLNYFWGWKIYFILKNNSKEYQWWYCLNEKKDGKWVKVDPEITTLDDLTSYLRTNAKS